MPLPKSWTQVTPLSKTIVMIVVIFLPAVAFFFGVRYQQKIDQPLINQVEKAVIIKKEVIITPVVQPLSSRSGIVKPLPQK